MDHGFTSVKNIYNAWAVDNPYWRMKTWKPPMSILVLDLIYLDGSAIILGYEGSGKPPSLKF